MANKQIKKQRMRERRRSRVRKKIQGTADRPRMSVCRSLKNIQAQLIDDTTGRSLLGISSNSSEIRDRFLTVKGKCEKGREVGRLLAAKAVEAGITQVV